MSEQRTARVLRQHVETDRLLGVDGVPRRAVAAVQAPVPAAEPAMPRPAATPSSAPVAATAPPPSRPTGPVPQDREGKAAALAELANEHAQYCNFCLNNPGYTQIVFGEGDPDAQLMIVGEGPGAEEDRQGRPFVGASGQLLEKQLGAMGLSREQVYIANVVKSRPPNNRTPTPAEAADCGIYLKRQIEIIAPKAILTLGGPAAKYLLDTTTGVTRLRGNWHTYNDADPPIPVMPTFHPAYLLRSYTPENRRTVWGDLQKVMERLGLPTK
ncbi:MAG: uracil-DNA glycosylase [Planctomycetota bacterium]